VKLADLKFTEIDITSPIENCRIRGLEGHSNMDMIPVPSELADDIEVLKAKVDQKRDNARGATDFPLQYGELIFRVALIPDINGEIYSLRKIETQRIDTRACGLNPKIRDVIMARRSGLIIVSGPFRSGKTTLASAIIREWLEANGGKAITLEDPPEALLSGQHGEAGICYQVMIDRRYIEEEIEKHARSTYDMLFIGEIRGPRMAAAATVNSANGRLILATYHADSVQDTLTRWLTDTAHEIDKGEARNLLSRSLAAVLHMATRDGKPPMLDRFLLPDYGEGVRGRIKSGEVPTLENDVQRQRQLMVMGKLIPKTGT